MSFLKGNLSPSVNVKPKTGTFFSLCCVHTLTVFFCFCSDEDDEGERNTVPLTPLGSFFSDSDSLKQQKKKKAKKMREGKMPKVKKRKKEVRCNQLSTPSAVTSDTTAWQTFWLEHFSPSHTAACLMSLQSDQRCVLAAGAAARYNSPGVWLRQA